MMIRKPTAISIPNPRCARDLVASVSFTLHGSLHENCVEADFVHSIVGRIRLNQRVVENRIVQSHSPTRL